MIVSKIQLVQSIDIELNRIARIIIYIYVYDVFQAVNDDSYTFFTP